MKTQAHIETNQATPEGDFWLDQYPVEVLEQVLKILQAQRGKAPARPRRR